MAGANAAKESTSTANPPQRNTGFVDAESMWRFEARGQQDLRQLADVAFLDPGAPLTAVPYYNPAPAANDAMWIGHGARRIEGSGYGIPAGGIGSAFEYQGAWGSWL